MRTHTLDWQARMERWAFSSPPAGVVPKPSKRRGPRLLLPSQTDHPANNVVRDRASAAQTDPFA